MLGYALRMISAVMSVFFMMTSIGACSVREDSGQVYDPVEGVPIDEVKRPAELHILQSRPEISKQLQEAADFYAGNQEELPKVTVQTVGDQSDYRSTLRSRLLAGEPADLFHLLDYSDLDSLMQYLQDLSSLSWMKGSLLEPMKGDGKIWGIPYSIQGAGLIVNRKIFEAAEVSLTAIHDFDSLSEAFRELQQKIDAGTLAEDFPDLEAVISIPGQSTEYLSGYTADLLLTGAFESREEAYGAVSASMQDAENAEEFIKLLIDCSANRYGWSGLTKVTVNQAVEDGIASGRVAAVLYDTDAWRTIYAVNPDLEGCLSLLPVFFRDWEQGVVYVGAPACWAVNASSSPERKRAAFSFLEWLYRTQEGADCFAQQFGAVSPFRDTAADTGIALHRQLLDAVSRGQSRPRVTAETPSGWGEEVYAVQLQEYFTDYDKEWEKLIETCQEEWIVRRLKS